MTYRTLRFPLTVTDYQKVSIPAPGVPLSVALSRTDPDREIDMWALAEHGANATQVGIYIIGTGNPMPPNLVTWGKFIGTVVCPNGLVWHVWEGPLE